MNRVFLKNEELPFCKGCGHTTVAENLDMALQMLNIPVLDVIVVTDIGCHGIIDKSLNTHTVHGLHGRSVALASGISLSLNNPDKKVIVFIGDGGATIGMQHLIDAAHKNFNMTVLVHNNMLYGMTGGQPSEFTPAGFKTPTMPDGSSEAGFDICKLVTVAGANYVSRVIGIGNISENIAEAISAKGFSLVEIMEVCPSYAMKANPGMKLREVVENAGLQAGVFVNKNLEGHHTHVKENHESLLDTVRTIPQKFQAFIKNPVRIMITGSAGEGVQVAAEVFAKAAISAGLNVTKKGSYPVTVGIGFSSSDIIISPEKILYTGSPSPDYMIITSKDGADFSVATLNNMKSGKVFIESDLDDVRTELSVIKHGFRNIAGGKNAALYSLLFLARHENLFDIEAILELLRDSKFSGKTDWDKIAKEM